MTPFAHDIDTGIDVATNRPEMRSFATLNKAVSKERMTAANDEQSASPTSLLTRRRKRWSRLKGR